PSASSRARATRAGRAPRATRWSLHTASIRGRSMRMTRQILIQMAIFAVIATTALAIMVLVYMRLPAFLGVGQYRVTLELPETGGLYPRGNVTYRGVEVGEVKSVRLTDTGVVAELSLNSEVKIPADLEAEVHSVSSVGE